MDKNTELYYELLAFCAEIKKKQKFRFESNLEFSKFNETCYIKMYQNNKVPIRPLEFKNGSIPDLKEVCPKCATFHTSKRNEMIKGFDIQYGHWFEKAFRDFLQSKGIKTEKKGFPYPDIEVIKGGKPVAYFELKYIRAPFVYANKLVSNERWCYECSLTLDVGDKLFAQREKIEKEILPTGAPVYYVWWYDAPCIKGVFFMSADEIFEYWDIEGTSHYRKERKGDLETTQEKGKIYPPLLKMKGLNEFIEILSKL
jgi:hypothetical protein